MYFLDPDQKRLRFLSASHCPPENDMKRHRRNNPPANSPSTDTSGWLDPDNSSDEELIPFPEQEAVGIAQRPFTAEYFFDVAASVELAICDLPVWKALVARVGLREARRILRRGVFVNRITDGSPRN